jgi:hypothetical protein
MKAFITIPSQFLAATTLCLTRQPSTSQNIVIPKTAQAGLTCEDIKQNKVY